MQKKALKLVAIAAVPVVLGGWFLFRPELLFVNNVVNEQAPTATSTGSKNVAAGSFISSAHETAGKATIIETGGKRILRLSGFKTSNGPDVRVYITSGGRPGKGSIPLGALKGNIGDQNYEIPASASNDQLKSVSIWCERFSVEFGSASLTPIDSMQSRLESNGYLQLASFGPETEVTFGKIVGDARFAGMASLIEKDGRRHVSINFTKLPSGMFESRLYKKETLSVGAAPNAEFVSLGVAKRGTLQSPVSKALDLWLYRSIAIIDVKTSKIVSFVYLRSAQESKRSTPLA